VSRRTQSLALSLSEAVAAFTQHHFGEIIFIAFTCIVCGVKSYELMEEFCDHRK